MRKTYTTTKKKARKTRTKQMASPMSIPDLREYLKDEQSIKATLSAVADLQNNYGWKVIQTYMNETRKQLMNQLLNLNEPDMVSRDRAITRIQDNIHYIDYILGLPQFIINEYNKGNIGMELDPYK